MNLTLRFAHWLGMLLLIVGLGVVLSVERAAVSAPASDGLTAAAAGGYFVENIGQFRAGALYQGSWAQGTLFVAQDALWLSYLDAPGIPAARFDADTGAHNALPPRGGAHLRLTFVGANAHPVIEPFAPLTSTVNYFQGDDPAHWYTNVPTWGGVRVAGLYPGIDLEVRYEGGQSHPRLVVRDAARADLNGVHLRVEGADELQLAAGNAVALTERGKYALPLFEVVYRDGTALSAAAPVVTGAVISHPFAGETAARAEAPPEDVLPSNLLYATFLGGNGYDYGTRITRDAAGATYIGGTSHSFDFPTTPGTFDPVPSPSEYRSQAFVTKFNPAGTDLVFSTFIDGSNSDYVSGLEVDSSGIVYLAGETWSNDFPTTPGVPTTGPGGVVDGFALKLSATGSTLLYSMYLGGSDIDYARDMALGVDGTAVVIGTTLSPDFPVTPDAYDTIVNDFDIFVTRVSADGTSLLYSTALGGSVKEYGFSVVLDSANSAYALGRTESVDYPTTPGVFDPTPASTNLVISKLTPAGDDLEYSTALNGRSGTSVGKITVDAEGYAYITAEAESGNFPVTEGAFDTECGVPGAPCSTQQRGDGVLFKFTPDGSDVVFGTYFGGAVEDWGSNIAVDHKRNIYVMGRLTSLYDLQVTPGSYPDPGPLTSPFAVYKFDPTGSELLHLARTPGATGEAMYLEGEDLVWLTGGIYPDHTFLEATAGAYDTTPNGGGDGGAVRLALPKPATIAEVAPEGGVVTAAADVFTATYTVATQTFTETAVITHAPRHALSMPPLAPHLTLGDPFVNYAATLSDTLLAPLRPYTLTIAYDPAEGSAAGLYFWDGSAWQPEPTAQVNPTMHQLVATPDKFGWWIVTRGATQLHLPLVSREGN